MIEIDGSIGSGGGQMLRSGLGLSALTGKPFRIFNIRKGRNDTGIKEQHLQAINAVKELCDAEVEGAKLKSEELTFKPRKIKEGNLNINISTAGSVALALQSLLIPTIKTDLIININGGATYGKWAAPVDFLKYVFSDLLNKMGYKIKVNIEKHGFYPKGGAIVKVHSYKADLKPINLIEKGKILSVEGISIASNELRNAKVAERQADEAVKVLSKLKIKPKIKVEYVNSLCNGSGIQLWIKTENSILSGNSLGEKGKKAELVGEEAAKSLIFNYENGVVDYNAADQLLPYLAIVKEGKIKTSKITNHIKTNIFVIEKFLDVKFKIKDNNIECISSNTYE